MPSCRGNKNTHFRFSNFLFSKIVLFTREYGRIL